MLQLIIHCLVSYIEIGSKGALRQRFPGLSALLSNAFQALYMANIYLSPVVELVFLSMVVLHQSVSETNSCMLTMLNFV